MMDTTLKSIVDELFNEDEGEDRKKYRSVFDKDFVEHGAVTAIYNLGFMMGWDDGNSKKGAGK